MKENISIRDIVKSMNLTTRTLRYYEEIGLIESQQEGRGNRLYTKDEVSKILYLNELKNRGFSLKEIEGLLGNQCCNKKGVFLKERIEENKKTIEFLTWQNEKIMDEIEIIEKLDLENVSISIEDLPEQRYFVIESENLVESDPDVEKVWNLENYDIRDEKLYKGDFNKILDGTEDSYKYELYPHKNGNYILPEGKYLVAYSREGLNKQKKVFEKICDYLKSNNITYSNEIYVDNKFRIFCKREKKVVLITKNIIKID